MDLALLSALTLLSAPVPQKVEDLRSLESGGGGVAVVIDMESLIVLDDLRLFTMIAAPKGVSPSPGYMILHTEVDCATRTIRTLNRLGVRGDADPVALPMEDREPERLGATATGRALGSIVCDGVSAGDQRFSSTQAFRTWAAGLPRS